MSRDDIDIAAFAASIGGQLKEVDSAMIGRTIGGKVNRIDPRSFLRNADGQLPQPRQQQSATRQIKGLEFVQAPKSYAVDPEPINQEIPQMPIPPSSNIEDMLINVDGDMQRRINEIETQSPREIAPSAPVPQLQLHPSAVGEQFKFNPNSMPTINTPPGFINNNSDINKLRVEISEKLDMIISRLDVLISKKSKNHKTKVNNVTKNITQ